MTKKELHITLKSPNLIIGFIVSFGEIILKVLFTAMDLRVFANAYNLFTITGVKFVDPEHPDDELGRLYPLNKTYTLGVLFTF